MKIEQRMKGREKDNLDCEDGRESEKKKEIWH